MTHRWPFELAHHMALLPVVALGWKRVGEPAYWWLGLAFFVSWLADSAAHVVNPSLVSLVYPLTQVGLVALVLVPRQDADRVLGVAALVAVSAVIVPTGLDVLLRTVAWGAIAGMAWPRKDLGLLRWSLVLAFGVGLLAWYGYVLWPGWASWIIYQGVRAMGISVFCVAVWR